MKIRIRSMAGFRHILGRETEVDLSKGSTVEDLLNALCSGHADLSALLFEGADIKEDVNILISGKNIESQKGLKTELSEGDEVVLFPAAIGG
jgi:MoaD family protein